MPAIALLALFTLIPMTACNRSEAAKQADDARAAADPNKVHVNPELLEAIKIGKATHQSVTTRQTVAARIQTDASRMARIGSPVDGRITKVLVFEGQRVHKGQVLATLHSNALSDTQFAFVKACSQEKLAEQSAERARLLVQSDVIGKAELQKREAEVLQEETEVASLRAQLRGLGMSENAIQNLETTRKLNSDYPIVATISGTVIDRKIAIGQVIQPADPAFFVADLSNLWFVADVPEEQAGSLAVGKTVVATIPSVPDHPVSGHLSFVSPVVNPETRTVQARMNLPNEQGLFKPEMLASMTFESEPENDLTIPTTAVVREENKDYVFVQQSPSDFILHPDELGPEVADRRVLLHGLSSDQTIVLDGAFHLNNKRKQDQIKGGN
ncbi:MAG TPA: efflux RND transporter periplasmic adaptor subunit [Acidobacteriaceae bacterium]|nr:efflux RND transporter periplasmic adaptor subunit [Acidobacteriaceae bacterium]